MANEDLQSAVDWLAENKLSLNAKKTNYMFFNMAHNTVHVPKLWIGHSLLNMVETQKFLGITFDSKLSWKPHTSTVIRKLNACLGATRRARPFLNKNALFCIYYSLMQTHIQYCCTTWASSKARGNKVILQRLQSVCNKYFRLVYNLDRNESVRMILKQNNILNMNQLYDLNLGQLMYKAKINDLPCPLQKKITIGITRPCLFSVKPVRIQQTLKSVCQAAPRVWNSLPSDLSIDTNYAKFSSDLKKYILNK